MPYTDIQKQNYEDILYVFTKSIINGRFDILNTDSIRKNIEDKYQTNDSGIHSLFYDPVTKEKTDDVYYYTSYGTYRKDITGDLDILKKSETLVPNTIFNNAYYNINKYEKTNQYTLDRLYNYKGIALNYSYPCNGHVASLEDIFAEYGYDYIVAQEQERFNNKEPYYYFEETTSYSTQFTYEILPIGTVYTDEETGELITVEYDGTTIPTAQQIISGKLYIAVQSGKMPIRRIYFNNNYMPTLFVNDDKYDLSKTMSEKYSETTYQYILNNNQIMKLCDVTRYKSYGYFITFKDKFLIYKTSNNAMPFGGYWSVPNEKDSIFSYIYTGNDKDQVIKSINIEKSIPNKNTLNDFNFGMFFRVFAILYTHDVDKIKWYEGIDNTNNEYKKTHILDNSYTYELSKSITRQIYKYEDEYIINDTSLFSKYNDNQYYVCDPYYIFNNKSTSTISEPHNVNETTDLLVCVIPGIYFEDFKAQNNIQQPAANTNITLSYESGTTAEILLTPTDIQVNTDNEIYKTGGTNNNILGFDNDKSADIISQYVTANDIVTGTTTSIPIPTLTINNIGIDLTKYKCIWFSLQNIAFQELTEYILTNNILSYSLEELKLNITLSGRKTTCGFFTENEDYTPVFIEEVEYEPVFLEWVDDVEPVFIILD